jgi:4-amino-4-deoxy-L-arabinose transferase-like glycosyltransferase
MTTVGVERKNEQRQLLIAVLCIFLVKLAFFLLIVPIFKDKIGSFYGIGSADNYAWIAKSIDLGYGYRVTPDTSLTLMREPGYPYFLAALLYLFDNDHGAAIIANLVFTSLSAFLVSQIARSVWTAQWMFLVAPILFLLHPGIIIAELRGGVEIPFTLLLLCFLLLLRRALAAGSASAYIKAGLLLGVASCVRSTALLFPVFLFIKDVICARSWTSFTRAASKAALLLVSAFIVLSPWIIRNYLLVGQFVPTASVRGVTLQAGNYICTHADGRKSFQELDADAAEMRNKLAAEHGYRFKPGYYQLFLDPRDEVSFNDSLGQQVVRQYLQSPTMFVKCASKNALNIWIAGKNRFATIANIFIQLPYIALALGGIILGRRSRDRSTIILILLFVAYTVLVYIPIHAQARYSIPLVPILSILAAIPISILLDYGFGNRVRGDTPRAGA